MKYFLLVFFSSFVCFSQTNDSLSQFIDLEEYANNFTYDIRYATSNNFLEELFSTIKQRDKNKKKDSYTKNLLKQGKKKIAQKIGEESTELILDYLSGTKKRVIEETSDLLYHLMVLLYSKNISIKDIEKELEKRKKNVR